jgi:hypothetical protein
MVTGRVDQPMRNRPGSLRAASTNEPVSTARYRSVSWLPRIASYTRAASSTLRASGPTVPSDHHRCSIGAALTRPRWGLSPNSPQNADGIRIEPPPSPPRPIGTMPEATAAAVPPLEPPGVWPVDHGLCVIPWASDSV